MKTSFLFLLMLTLLTFSCTKEANTVKVSYQLDTSTLTGDHFYVSYVTATGDTITEHEHPGFNYSFNAAKPFNAYIKAEVNPIDSYDFTVKIVVDGTIVQQQKASTASGGIATIVLNYLIQ